MQCCNMQTIPQIIDALGGPTEVARLTGQPVPTVSAWKHRNKIPARHWPSLVSIAREKGVKGITLELFFSIPSKEVAA